MWRPRPHCGPTNQHLRGEKSSICNIFRGSPGASRIESQEHSPFLPRTQFSLTPPALGTRDTGQGGGEGKPHVRLVLGDPSEQGLGQSTGTQPSPAPVSHLLPELGCPQPGHQARRTVMGKFSRNPVKSGHKRAFMEIQTKEKGARGLRTAP